MKLSAHTALSLAIVIAWLVQPFCAAAQNFGFAPPAEVSDPALPTALRDLAERVLPAYQETNPERYLTSLAALQMAVGDFTAARDTRRALQQRLQEQNAWPGGRSVVLNIYTDARAIEATDGVPFADAYARAFRETIGSFDDLTAYELEDSFTTPIEPLRDNLQRMLGAMSGSSSVALEQALELVQAWFAFDAYRSFAGLVAPLLAEDNDSRYSSEEITIPVSEIATLQAALVRPRNSDEAERLPTLLEFTLERSSRDPREAAAHGYASLIALPRIAGDAASRPRAPFESDGDDARAAIAWIEAQPWSDGRVGMQGHGYGGYVAWSAAKRLPPALRAIATSDPMAPGIDVPSSNRIMLNASYRWLYGLVAPPGDELASNDEHWREMNEEWYRAGRPYREFPAPAGRARAIFQSWLNHPSYDRFWQKWLPFREELASVNIPVLTVTGYYSSGETGALYYFTQHHEHLPDADHTLLIGPWDGRSVERGAAAWDRDLPLDAVARIDSRAARYAWFEHVLKGAERPALLQAEVNYALAGVDEWRHAPSLDALERDRLRLYLQASPAGAPHRLAMQRATAPMTVAEVRDLRDRSDASWRPAQQLVLREVDPREGTLYMTEPFDEPLDLVGRMRGELDFTVNQYDADLVMTLYELTADGDYVKLFDPAFAFRASYARDRVRRGLLLNGVRQQLSWQSERLVGRRLAAGSRLVLALGVNKRADQQINYGAGGDVSEESIEDALAPTRIVWHEGTFIELPFAAPEPAAVSERQ